MSTAAAVVDRHLSELRAGTASASIADSQASVLTIELEIQHSQELGIEIVGGTNESAFQNDDGIYVGRVSRGSIAGRDGRLRAGDRILSVNGTPLGSLSHEEAVSAFRTAKSEGHLTMAIELSDDQTPSMDRPVQFSSREVLARSLLRSYQEGAYTDCVVIAGVPPNEKRFPAHRIILAAQSRILRDMLYTATRDQTNGARSSESPPKSTRRRRSTSQPRRKRSSRTKPSFIPRNSQNGDDNLSSPSPPAEIMSRNLSPTRSLLSETTAGTSSSQYVLAPTSLTVELELPDINPETCGNMLSFLYSGSLPALGPHSHGYFRLVVAAIRYEMPHLRNACELQLTRMVELKNVCEFLLLAKRYECELLSRALRRFLTENFDLVKESKKWASLKQRDPELVISVLENLVTSLVVTQGPRSRFDESG